MRSKQEGQVGIWTRKRISTKLMVLQGDIMDWMNMVSDNIKTGLVVRVV